MKKKKKIILGSAITSAVAIPTIAVASVLTVKHHKESNGGGHKVATDSSKESLLKTIQGMELDDNEKVSAIPGAENKGEIAYNQDIIKLTNLKQAALKENISVQELQKIKEKILQVIQDAKNANSQQQNANDNVRSATDNTGGTTVTDTETTEVQNVNTPDNTGLIFEELPPDVKAYYQLKGVTATTTVLTQGIFANQTLPKGFTIPNSITLINQAAFENATLPKGFTIPLSVKSIGFSAFVNATLPDGFTLHNLITSIGDLAFQDATLPKSFTIPSSVTSIGNVAFGGVTLPVDFTIPSSVTSIGSLAFLSSKLPDGTPIQTPQLNGNDLTLNFDGTWS